LKVLLILCLLWVGLGGTQLAAQQDTKDDEDQPFWKFGVLGCKEARSRPHIPGLIICWNHGLRIFSTDERLIDMFIGGRVQYDFALFDPDDTLQPLFEGLPGHELRRASINFSGTIGKRLEFELQPDFGSLDNETRDMWLGFRGIPFFGTVRLGRQKEPISLNEHTSSNDVTFMERSLGSAFTSNRTTGITASNHYFKHWRAYWGVFWSSGSDTVNYSIRLTTSRFAWSPEHFLHLGFGYARRQNTQDSTEIKSRPESHLAPFLVDTGEFDSSSNDLFVPEVAWVRGPLSLQGEYFIEPINASDYGNPIFQSGYAQVSYFLTGEHRNYSSEDGHFLAINPKRNFIGRGFAEGPGAWEVAARVSTLDLNSGTIRGGKLTDLTAGLNWYLNRYVRVSWNYVHADVESTGSANIFMMRLQLTFR